MPNSMKLPMLEKMNPQSACSSKTFEAGDR
jgi:hypothetical protein